MRREPAADGVVYAEAKLAPEPPTPFVSHGRERVVEDVLESLRVGVARTRLFGHTIDVRLPLTALRQATDSLEVMELAVRFRYDDVLGFDIAGPEAGWQPTRHIPACEYVKKENFNLTPHTGEKFGLSSI